VIEYFSYLKLPCCKQRERRD